MSNDAPFLRWFVDDYLGDTGHLSCLEHGAYTQILWACWKRGGSVPERHLQRLVGMTAEEWSESRDTLAEFFEIDAGLWRHDRIGEEIEHIESKRSIAAAAGKKSARSRLRGRQGAESKGNTPETTAANASVGSTDVERRLNVGSTSAQPTPNYVDVEVDVEVDERRSRPSDSNDDDTRARASAVVSLSSSVPSDWISYLDVLQRHGVNVIAARQRRRDLDQLRQWHGDSVTLTELDAAATKAAGWRQDSGDAAALNVGFIARALADTNREGTVVARTNSAGNHTGFAQRDYHNDPLLARLNGASQVTS